MTILDITAFGAVSGGDATVNRTSIQAAITAASAGDTIYIPSGTFTCAKVPAGVYTILVNKALTFSGAGVDVSTIAMDPASIILTATNHVFEVTSADVTFRGFAIDGNKPGKGGVTDPDDNYEHHHGISVQALRVLLEDMYVHDLTGDGVQLYNGAGQCTIRNSRVYWCQRDGLSFSPTIPGVAVADVVVDACDLSFCSRQQIDNEHGPANDIEVRGCVIRPGQNDYCIAMSGADGSDASHDWYIHDNQIDGGMFAVWTDAIRIEDNHGINATTKPAVELSRATDDVQILRNDWRMTQTTTPSASGILVLGTTGAGSGASRVLIAGNFIKMDFASTFGVRVEGAVSVEIADNDLVGAGSAAAGFHGIFLRATVEDRDFESAVVMGNRVRDFGQRGVSIAGNATAALLYLDVRCNQFSNGASPAPMTTAMSLDDGTGAVKRLIVRDNQLGTGVVTDAINIPAGAQQSISASLSGLSTRVCPRSDMPISPLLWSYLAAQAEAIRYLGGGFRHGVKRR